MPLPDASTSHASTPARRWRRFAKRAGFAALGLLIIALVIFFMLPVWISNEQGRNYVLGRLNKRLAATVAISRWQLGWFRGTDIEELTVTLPDGKQFLRCPRIQTDLTLWSLLWGNYDLGNTRIEGAQLTATKYADGSDDFTRLVGSGPSTANPLGTLRGNIVCQHALISLAAQTATSSITISDVSAEIPIASHTAPIHLRASGLVTGAGVTKVVSLEADLPGPSTWAENPAALLGRVRMTAAGLPTAVLATWANLSPAWQASLGRVVHELKFVTRPRTGQTSLLDCEIRGEAGFVQVNMLLQAAGRHLRLSPASVQEPAVVANLALSGPLKDVLRQVNPMLGAIEKCAGPVEITINDLALDVERLRETTGTAFVYIPEMTLAPEGLVREVLALSRARTGKPARIEATRAAMELLKVTLGGQKLSYSDLGLTLAPQQRLAFSGSVGMDRTLDLVLTLPLPRAFTSATLQVPVKGTVDQPRLVGPK